MKLTPPKKLTWWIAVILGVVGIIGSFVAVPVISGITFWLAIAGLALLALGCAIKGL